MTLWSDTITNWERNWTLETLAEEAARELNKEFGHEWWKTNSMSAHSMQTVMRLIYENPNRSGPVDPYRELLAGLYKAVNSTVEPVTRILCGDTTDSEDRMIDYLRKHVVIKEQ